MPVKIVGDARHAERADADLVHLRDPGRPGEGAAEDAGDRAHRELRDLARDLGGLPDRREESHRPSFRAAQAVTRPKAPSPAASGQRTGSVAASTAKSAAPASRPRAAVQTTAL